MSFLVVTSVFIRSARPQLITISSLWIVWNIEDFKLYPSDRNVLLLKLWIVHVYLNFSEFKYVSSYTVLFLSTTNGSVTDIVPVISICLAVKGNGYLQEIRYVYFRLFLSVWESRLMSLILNLPRNVRTYN